MSLPEKVHRWLRIPYILHVKRRGNRGPLVIFLHGLASRGDIWNDSVAELSHDYRCVQVDLLGHGVSPKPSRLRYSTTDHQRSLRWTLFWRGIWGKKIFVTHSMGGLIAIRYAAQHPRGVKKLICVALPVYRRAEAGEEAKKFEATLDKGFLVFYRAMRALPKPAAIRSARAITRALPRIAGTAYLDDDTWYPAVSSLAHTIELQTALADIEKMPSSINLTLIYGRVDQLVLARNLKLIQKNRPGTKLVPIVSYHELSPKSIRPIVRAVKQRS